MQKHARKIAVGAAALVSIAAIAGLVYVAAPVIMPLLPERAQVVLGATIDTVPGTVDELLTSAGLGESGQYGDSRITHADVDVEYLHAASTWPWDLPPGWGFAEHRGAADTPGQHWNGMGVQAAFSMWARASLAAVSDGGLSTAAANALLDEVEDAYDILRAEGVLKDRTFIETSVTPLRQ